MTEYEVFMAMQYFLEQFYERTGSDDVGALLGDMLFLESGKTMDPAGVGRLAYCCKKGKIKAIIIL